MTAPTPRKKLIAGDWLGTVLSIAGTCLFVIAAFTYGGDSINGIPALSWAFGGFAALMLMGAVP
jgi:hypothetical protein